MAKRKTQYVISFNADPALVNQTIVNWLTANKFVYKEKYDTRYYQSGDGVWTVSKCFEYYIQGNQVIINAYLKTPKNPFPLDSGALGAANTSPYINQINQLVAAINGLSSVASDPYGQNVYGQSQQVYQSNASFIEEAEKRNRGLAIGAFALSVVNVIIMFIGYIYFWLIICAYILGVQGLQAKEKLIAISSLVINTVVLVAFILVRAGILFF